MGEYDFELLHSRNWFEYDSARRALPGIVESWSFDTKTGRYFFKISKKARWSDGDQIKSSDLITNLKRAFKSGSSYGKGISAIIDPSQIQIQDDLSFSIQTRSAQPSDAFFERMGSIFMAIVNPKDLNEDLSLKSNTISAGPFVISSRATEEVHLKPNEYFSDRLPNSPEKIVFRRTDKDFSIRAFIAGKSWENYFQLYSYLPIKDAQILLDSKLPLWTRTYDRISLFRAGNGLEKLHDRENVIKAISVMMDKRKLESFPLNIKRATSLQPAGFSLHQPLKVHKTFQHIQKNKSIKILAIEGLATEFHTEILNPLLDQLNINATWDKRPLNEFVDRLNSDESYDVALVSFGVADPEPSTWMSLVIDSEFIHVLPKEKKEFQNILKIQSRKDEVAQLKGLLERLHDRGSYEPLFWGSTMSVVQKNMSLEKIRELDETVDLSKIIFKK